MTKVTIKIDDQEIQVEAGTNLIEAAKIANNQIPYYCYHAGLTPDGNCRMCLVQVEKIPKPVIACKTGAIEGMVVHTNTPEVKQMRQSIMEFLLINHPLDCPTCDQAGECRLQDYYMDYDLKASRFKEQKVQKDKMVDLGASVLLDEERCIVCTRCVRFCQEIAKDEELYVQDRGNHSMVATFPGIKMKNPYSGNTIDICPVGALTSKDFRYQKRVWYLTYTDSICPGCSRGCNISLHHEEKKVYRLKPRHNAEVNDYWMCDFGRYDYKFINENRRLKPGYRKDGQFIESSYDDSFQHVTNLLSDYKPGEIAFITSARESNQEIDAFVQFADGVFDTDYIYYSKNDPKDVYSDDILITPDKNPNTAHVQKLKLKPLKEISPDCKAVIVQRDLSEADFALIKEKNLKVLALFATNETIVDNLAETIFPIPTYAEQSGSFTNLDGIVQTFQMAFEPRGDARLIVNYLLDIKKVVGEIKKAS